LGQRVEKKVGSVYTEYVYGAYGELFNLHDRTTWTAHIIPMGATPLAVYQDGTTRFFHANGLGSTTFLTDHAGAPTQKTLFYPWGQRWTIGGTLKDERFASLGQRDVETTTWQDPLDLPIAQRLCFRQAGTTPNRLYTSGLGRWMSPDPLAGHVTNPQSLNRHAYVLTNR